MPGSLHRCRIAASFPTADCFAASSARGSLLSNAFWFRALLYEKKTGEIACSVAQKAPDAVATCSIEKDALRIGV